MSKPCESTAFSNNAPGFTLCEVVELLVCYDYDTWILYSKSIPELSSMERVYVVVYGLSCCPQFAIMQKDAFTKHYKVAYLLR